MSVDFRTRYLGLDLAHPLVAGASPLVDDLALASRVVKAGAAAIVMHSLFEEQLTGEAVARERFHDVYADAHVEASGYLPSLDAYRLGPDEYMEQLRRLRCELGVPVIASLNGTTRGSWLSHARSMEQAGASAIELNLYDLSFDLKQTGAMIEQRAVDIVRAVKGQVGVPVAVKLSPFYSALPAFAARLAEAGADGLVLFNRFYQPDIDVEELEVVRTLRLSDPAELLLRLRWLAILSGRIGADLALSGGVHSGVDAVKGVMAGAHCVQVVSALLRHGPERMAKLVADFQRWVEEHEYESVEQMRGSMNLSRCPDPRTFERANYISILQAWKPERDAPSGAARV